MIQDLSKEQKQKKMKHQNLPRHNIQKIMPTTQYTSAEWHPVHDRPNISPSSTAVIRKGVGQYHYTKLCQASLKLCACLFLCPDHFTQQVSSCPIQQSVSVNNRRKLKLHIQLITLFIPKCTIHSRYSLVQKATRTL